MFVWLVLRSYVSLRDDDLLELPVPEVMNDKQCLVAVWVTNKEQQHRWVGGACSSGGRGAGANTCSHMSHTLPEI